MSLKTEVAPTFGTFLDAVLVEGVSTTILPIGVLIGVENSPLNEEIGVEKSPP